MTKVIYKYEIPVGHSADIELPVGFLPLAMAAQGAKIYLWAMIDPDETRKAILPLRVVGTGEPIREGELGRYYKTVHMENGLVFHIFQDCR